MADDIPVKISQNQELKGRGPIVILGPNGSGKTRHAVNMLNWNGNNAEMVAALRNIALSEHLGMQPLAQAKQNLTRFYQQRRSQYWELSNEINQLFSKIMAEDAASAVAFRDNYLRGNATEPEKTKVTVIQNMWERLFPGRHISFAGYSPKVRSNLTGGESEYPAQRMSDGERVALYLAARVLDTSKPILIVDEPEVHFHSRLAVRFWNELEDLRKDVRLVYITHDLSFALSRRDATYVILMPGKEPNVVYLPEEIPRELASSLLSAASFSIQARRIVFCEGEEGKSLDCQVYSSWFYEHDTAVVPVGSCRDVVETVARFADTKLVVGLTAIGVVDRDYWPDNYLNSFDDSIHVLPVHEIENLLLLKGIFTAVAKHLGKSETNQLYDEFIQYAKSKFKGNGELLIYQVSERFKRRAESEFFSAINGLKPESSTEETRNLYAQRLTPSNWQTSPVDLFQTEQKIIEEALDGPVDKFLKVLPGKVFFADIEKFLGIDRTAYVGLICAALKVTDDSQDSLHGLGKQIENTLEPILPSRKPPAEESPSQ